MKKKKRAEGPKPHKDPTSLRERVILTSIADGVVVSDAGGQVTLVNEAAARMLGLDPQTALGQPVRTLFESLPGSGRMSALEVMDHLYADPYTHGQGGEMAEVTITVGPQVIRAHLAPVLTGVGEFLGLVTVLHDITQAVEAERDRSDFVLNLSTQLRAPLTAIRGYSEMLLRQASEQLDPQQERFLHIIQRHSDWLVALINDLLDISRLDSGQLQLAKSPVQMEGVIRNVADVIRPLCDQKGLHLTVDVEPNVGSVLGDEGRLTQVVSNLASNACRRTPEGGAVTLALSRSQDTAQVHVADTGQGFAPDEQAKLFERSQEVKAPAVSEATGTELELPIAKLLVERHGGRLWVESEPGQGSVFTFVLPLHTPAPDKDAGPEVEPAGPGHTVLVVEDDNDVARLIELQLRQEGFEVLVAENGKKALELARTQDIDLITLDILLPDITGMEVLRQLKAERATARIPVIIVSVLQPDMSGEDARAVDHITKPFALERLMDSIRRSLAGS